MNWPFMLIFNLVLVASAVMTGLIPLFSRPGIFFGITVDREFKNSPRAKLIVKQYRRIVIATTFVCTGVLWFAAARLTGLYWPAALVSTLFLQLGGGIAAIVRANKRVREFAHEQPLRTVSLQPFAQKLPAGWGIHLGPIVIVIVAGAVLLARRASILPEVFRGALSPLLIALVTDILFLWLAWLAITRTRRINDSGPTAGQDRLFKRAGYFALLFFAYLMTAFQVFMSFSTIRIAEVKPGSTWNALPVAVMAFVWLIFAAILVTLQLRAVKRAEEMDPSGRLIGDNTPDACWKWGIIYYNPEDPAFLVQKRIGFGWDMNYGNKWSWLLIAILLAVPFVLRLLWLK